MTALEILESFATAATARETLQLSALNNALQTASDDTRPVFTAAAEIAARDLLHTRAYQAGLAALITELTPEATP